MFLLSFRFGDWFSLFLLRGLNKEVFMFFLIINNDGVVVG